MYADAGAPLPIDLWLMETAGFSADRWQADLDEAERKRAGRFLHAHDRRDFVAAHLLARHLLASLGAGRPAALAFRPDDRGKPRLIGETADRDLRFNLTHTDGLVAVAAAEGAEIGIDAEAVDRSPVDEDIAPTVFTAAEMTSLDGLTGAAWRQAFFRQWTLKEAVVKMLGTGLSTPLPSVQVLGDPPRLVFLKGRPPKGEDCHLQVEAPTPRHLVALAVSCRGRPVTIRRRLIDGATWTTAKITEQRTA